MYFPFYVIFIKKMAKNKWLQFSAQGTHCGRLLENFSEQLLQKPEEVAVGTDPNID